MNWDESKHPRGKKGDVNGGKFTSVQVSAAADAADKAAGTNTNKRIDDRGREADAKTSKMLDKQEAKEKLSEAEQQALAQKIGFREPTKDELAQLDLSRGAVKARKEANMGKFTDDYGYAYANQDPRGFAFSEAGLKSAIKWMKKHGTYKEEYENAPYKVG